MGKIGLSGFHFPDHFLEETAAGQRAVEDLGQSELGLENRDVVAISGTAILARERMGQTPEPLAQQTIDLFRRQSVTDGL